MKHIFLFTILSLFCSCNFKPREDALNLGIIQISKDSLKIVLADSYNKIKDVRYYNKHDTLYIEILSIGHKKSSDEILIPLSSSTKVIILQNDKIYKTDSIPKKYRH